MSTDDSTGREDAPEVGAVARAEAQRRRRKPRHLGPELWWSLGAVIAGFWALAQREGGMGPQLDVASEEKSKAEETDDPQCRMLIAEVTALGKQYKEEVPELEARSSATSLSE